MALQVWLPLIGDFHNQGLAGNIDFTVTGTVSDEPSGKIGSCKKFDTSNVIAPFNFTLGPELSACLWVKWTTFPGSSTNDWLLHLGSTSGYNNALLVLSNYHGTLLTVGVGGKYDSTYQHGFSVGEWHHLAFTWDGTIGKLYVDGDLKKSYTNLTGGTITSTNKISLGSNVINSTTKLKGCLNDVRIYDNCLSAREVKEISKGLVAHWTMNDPTPVVGYKLRDSSGYGRHASFTSAGQPIVSGSVNGLSSPHYTNYVHFNTNAKFASASLPIEAIDRQYTFAWWGMLTNTTTGCMYWAFTGSSTRTNMYMANTATSWNTGDGNDGDPFRKAGTTTALGKLARGAWHHYAVTGDGEKTLLYVDGTLTAEAAFYKNLTYALGTASITPADRVFHINGWGQGTSYRNARTHMSDLRVYSTALSAEDVRELAKNPISVCKNGTLMCQEVVE